VLEHALYLLAVPLHLVGGNVRGGRVALNAGTNIDDNKSGVSAILQEQLVDLWQLYIN
jgi:hypothetical protein